MYCVFFFFGFIGNNLIYFLDITEQPPRPDVVPSVLERNALVSIEAQERAAEQRAAGLGKNLIVRLCLILHSI